MGITAEQYERASAAQTDYLRMCRLRRMDEPALRLLLSGDPARALPWIESAARHGVAEAQVRLGQMHLDGVGVERDHTLAFHWFERAARRGLPEAMNMAGRCYENGWGAKVDMSAAAVWYARSAEAGHDWGEYNLGHLYFDGRGVPRDLAAAMGWYLRAARRGHARAMNLLARGYEQGWGIARDAFQARLWYRRSAQSGYFRGQFNYATCLAADGRIGDALDWLALACRDAPREGLAGMAAALVRHPDSQLSAFGRRLGGAASAKAESALGRARA